MDCFSPVLIRASKEEIKATLVAISDRIATVPVYIYRPLAGRTVPVPWLSQFVVLTANYWMITELYRPRASCLPFNSYVFSSLLAVNNTPEQNK